MAGGDYIKNCKSPSVGASKTSYVNTFDAMASAVDAHDHTTDKGLQIPTGGIATGAINNDKLATDAVTNVKILNGTIEATKLAPSAIQALFPAGIILPYGGTTAPAGFLLCDGRSLSTTDPLYQALYIAIGTLHGSGSGTFNIPDMRGRFPRGVDNMGTVLGAANIDKGPRTQITGGAVSGVGTREAHTAGQHGHTASQNSHNHGLHDPTHRHNVYNLGPGGKGAADGGDRGVYSDIVTNYSGTGIWLDPAQPAVFVNDHNFGGETRPENIAVSYIIKY